MFSDYGRLKVFGDRYTNLIGFNDEKTHVYEMWYLISINKKWYAINNSGKNFSKGFRTKCHAIDYFKKKKNISSFQKYFMNKDYYGKGRFDKVLEFIIYQYEKQFKQTVEIIDDGLEKNITLETVIEYEKELRERYKLC